MDRAVCDKPAHTIEPTVVGSSMTRLVNGSRTYHSEPRTYHSEQSRSKQRRKKWLTSRSISLNQPPRITYLTLGVEMGEL
jgi:hypothetical protein